MSIKCSDCKLKGRNMPCCVNCRPSDSKPCFKPKIKKPKIEVNQQTFGEPPKAQPTITITHKKKEKKEREDIGPESDEMDDRRINWNLRDE